MKVTYQANEKTTIELEVNKAVELFEKLGPMQEVLASATCGKCGSHNIRFNHRQDSEGHDYYEMICMDCGAKLSFGNSKGKLFPRRYEQDPNDKKKPLMKDGKKVWLPNKGWTKWNSKTGKNE